MVRMLDGDHADAEGAGHGDRGGHARVYGEEAEAVTAVYLGGDGVMLVKDGDVLGFSTPWCTRAM